MQVFGSVSSGVSGGASTLGGSMSTLLPPSRAQFTYFLALAGIGIFFLGLSFTVALPLIVIAPAKFALRQGD